MDESSEAIENGKSSELGSTTVETSTDEDYPAYVIEGVKAALKQTEEGLGIPYTGIKDMLKR